MEVEIKRYSEHLEELVNERTRNLKESEMRYKSLIENIPQKIFTKDRELSLSHATVTSLKT